MPNIPTSTERALPAYRLPGLSRRAVTLVVELAVREFPGWHRPTGRPKALPVVDAARLTLRRLRRNATYQDLHEDFGVGKTTAWDYHQQMVAFRRARRRRPDRAVRAGRRPGLPARWRPRPTVPGRHRQDLRSGKHRRYGLNVQLLVDLHGRLIIASRAFPGSWHDVHCFREAGGVDLVRQLGGGIGDLGYEGEPDVVHTPLKKRPNVDRRGFEHGINRSFARVRVGVEWGVGHLRNWRILTTRYRSDLSRIDTDIHATVGLQKLNEQFTDQP